MDALTGIHNRRYFDHRLPEEIERCKRCSRRSCRVLFDVDHFKGLNDRFGHSAGDAVLKTIAQACAIVAPETNGDHAMTLARKLRILVGQLHFKPVPIGVTISLGVVEIGGAVTSSEIAVAAADKALFAAKKLGRNCECLYGGVGIPQLDPVPL